MKEPTSTLFQLSQLTPERFKIWKRNVPDFSCQFCGHTFQENDYFKLTYSNLHDHTFGNPLTCKNCDTSFTYEERLKLWDFMNNKKAIRDIALKLLKENKI